MEIPFDELWTPDEMSDYLTGDYDLVRDINAAILAGKLAAERREYKYTPPTPAPWELAQRTMLGYTPEKIEPKTITIPQINPIDAVAWAINAGVDIRPECLDKYHELTKPDKRGPKGGARDLNLYKVIAGLALVNGYRPDAKKQAQGWRENIVRTLDMEGIPIDPDRITDVIREAFDKLNNA